MAFSAELAAIRFGAGLSPRFAPPQSIDTMLAVLRGPDLAARKYAGATFEEFAALEREYRQLRGKASKADSEAGRRRFLDQSRDVRQAGQELAAEGLRVRVLRHVASEHTLRERLETFWSDHFTTRLTGGVRQYSLFPYMEHTVRSRVTGRFADLLKAAVLHPRMIAFLNQDSNIGPNSPLGRNSQKKRGLNENLAREVIELHTLGVNADYSQTDVRNLANVFTGLSITRAYAFEWDPRKAEPGSFEVLGRTYGGRDRGLGDVEAVLDDLAAHPATARHIAAKLAVHFVADRPDPALVDHMAAAFAASGGDLMAVYAAMLEHPAAWDPAPGSVKWPFDYVASALRALDGAEATLADLPWKALNAITAQSTARMGQQMGRVMGPDGWEEADSHWITPDTLANRITWAMAAPRRVAKPMPDPRDFVRTALGSRAPESVIFAAGAAQTRTEGVGLVLASPAFQRR
ncbi:MAG: DUF1800 domain-containing protein [Pseudomonadota bacterium]